MSRIDPRTPVIVGVGQLNRRQPDDRDTIDLMVDACRLATDDTGSATVGSRVDVVAVLDGLWSWADPGRLVAERIGARNARTILTTFGGQTPQALAATLASRIMAGDLEVGVICGGENNHTRRRAKLAARPLKRTPEAEGARPTERFGDPLDMGTELERSRGLVDPLTTYAVIESMLMAASTGGPDRHRAMLGELWAGFAAVAAANPHAADRSGPDAAAIVEVTPRNRMVTWPYPKALCANNDVDMAAAMILCSAQAASDLGISRERWIFPWAATEAHDTLELSARGSLDRSPALDAAGRAVLDHTELSIDDLTHIELYGCFPAIVEMTTDALGIDPTRPLTMTGGLGFAGSAMNTSTLHGLCAMTEGLREAPGVGLVQGNGGNATHHAFGVYSSEPSAQPFACIDRELDFTLATRTVAPADEEGSVEIEGYTVRFDHDGPIQAVASCLTADRARAWATSRSSEVMSWLMDGAVGETAQIGVTGELVG
jgi:acetyl-CoA C-acetyltransferase